MERNTEHSIAQQLLDNTGDIISAISRNEIDAFDTLTKRQQALADALSAAPATPDPGSLQTIKALTEKLAYAIEIARMQMAVTRAGQITIGIKKRVLDAYGTVTVSEPKKMDTPPLPQGTLRHTLHQKLSF